LLDRDVLVPNVAIEIVVPMNIALARLAARGRTDDDPRVARDRLTIYEAETLPPSRCLTTTHFLNASTATTSLTSLNSA
jgi:adenylate kinase family enzyme